MYGVRWVHVFEEDTPGAHVYRPATDDLPLSRRPRDAFELHRDGTAQIFTGGPDDRAIAHRATWKQTPEGIVVAAGAGGKTFRIVKRSKARLIVRQD
jgi:hypothetical protein